MRTWGSIALLVTLLAQLAACGGAPPKPLPAPLERALQFEQDGARRYARGEFPAAGARFAEAARLFTAIDDPDAALRNALHQARAELADGQAEEALGLLDRVQPVAAGLPARSSEVLPLRAQAQLALGQITAARATLTTAFAACAACPQQAGLHLLAARLALGESHAEEALTHAQTAAGLLTTDQQPTEMANAWRLQAEARLALGETTAALTAAEAALDLDRPLARPEKIARDWLLIGDAQKVGADEATALQGRRAKNALIKPLRSRTVEQSTLSSPLRILAVADGKTASALAAAAYRRALEVARAAGLDPLAEQARQRLIAIGISAP
ncbi:MAG: hypothetical protein CVU17_06765 [Betaproteobacteria bacterium HGW-Betaproteobacteria-11]|nr:MAG: hypothetical protein CVU17_06765 [Betaproteobacteria bacterium HGW-Betaproteobacteria-11]